MVEILGGASVCNAPPEFYPSSLAPCQEAATTPTGTSQLPGFVTSKWMSSKSAKLLVLQMICVRCSWYD